MLLSDAEIVAEIEAGNIKVEPMRRVSGTIPFDKDSAVQPSSLDLTIGKIFVPPAAPFNTTDPEPPGETGYQLKPGNTVVVETLEKIHLGANIAGFGFPPSKLARNSILITNPGHIDPGYSGHLKFTLINMGRVDLSLLHGEAIVSLLLIRLIHPATRDYQSRNAPPAPSSKKELLNRLSPDFAGYSARLESAATEAVDRKTSDFENKVKEAETKFDRAKIWIPSLITLAVAILTIAAAYLTDFLGSAKDDDLKKLEARVKTIETTQDVGDLRKRLDRIEKAVPATNPDDRQ
jgi:deoxycytidine triphosphate deaminase